MSATDTTAGLPAGNAFAAAPTDLAVFAADVARARLADLACPDAERTALADLLSDAEAVLHARGGRPCPTDRPDRGVELAAIKNRIDLVAFIERRAAVRWHRRGKELACSCPWPDHPDPNPSFYVNPEKQTFICFGCQRKGDLFSFAMLWDGFSFAEAVDLLAAAAGVERRPWLAPPPIPQLTTPAPNAAGEDLPDDPAALKRLAAQFRQRAERAEAELVQTKRANRALLSALENPHWRPTEKVVLVRTVRELERERRRGVTSDHRYRISPARIAHDYRKEKGATQNPSGTTPVMSQSSAIAGLQQFEERGILDVEVRPTRTKITTVTPHNGQPNTKEVTVREKWAAFVDPIAVVEAFADWRPEAPKARKPYTRRPTCPHCGSDDLRTVCGGCGCQVGRSGASNKKISSPTEGTAAWVAPVVAPTTGSNFSTSSGEPPWLADAPDPVPDDEQGAVTEGDRVGGIDGFVDLSPLAAARGPLAAADRATDRDRLHRARADLMARLEPIARRRGKEPVPKPPPSAAFLPGMPPDPSPDRWTD